MRCTKTFDSPGSYQIVDAGTGSPAELAAARGKVALVHEVLVLDYGRPAPLDQVAADAAAAGAAGVLVAVATNGQAQRAVVAPTTVPVAVLPHDEGDRLGTVLRTGPITVRTGGDPVSPHLYDLSYTVRDRLPTDTVFKTGAKDVATVTARYHADTPGSMFQVAGFGKYTQKFAAPFTRTEYVAPGERWQLVGRTDGVYEDNRRDYQAGTNVTEDSSRHRSRPVRTAVRA